MDEIFGLPRCSHSARRLFFVFYIVIIIKHYGKKKTITASTALAELFRVNFHGELRTVIESWRPCLLGDNGSVDALQLSHFKFDKKRIYSKNVYYDLIDLAAIGALAVPLSLLAYYLSEHSNLSNSYATLYRQLKQYRSKESQK